VDHPLVMLKIPMNLPKQLAPFSALKDSKAVAEMKDDSVAPRATSSATATSTPSTPKPTSTVAADTKVDEDARMVKFHSDHSLPDGTVVNAGDKLTKTWIVSNPGKKPWSSETKLVFLQGSQDLFVSAARQFAVTSLAANTTGQVSVDLQAPTKPGRYLAFFTLSDGKPFGPQLWLDVTVASLKPSSIKPVLVTDNTNLVVASKTETKTASPLVSVPVATPVTPSVPVATPVTPSTPVTPTAPVSVPAVSPKPVIKQKHAAELEELSAMGFDNKELNLFLLEKHNGKLQQVVNWLLENAGRS